MLFAGCLSAQSTDSDAGKVTLKGVNENFILVSIDVDRQKNETMNFRVHGTPTEIFLDPNGTEIKRIPGYTDTITFLNIVKEAEK